MAKKKKASPRSRAGTAKRPKKKAPSKAGPKAVAKTARRPVKAAAAKKTRPKRSLQSPSPSPGSEPAQDWVPIVGVGASAGGLEAFTELLQSLPNDTGMAFVLVSHLSHSHKSMLTELLARSTEMPMSQVVKAAPVRPNHVYVIPPNKDLVISDGAIKPQNLATPRRPHMAIDHFFRSLAQNRRNRAVGVVLSGTGTDGTLGLAAIKAEGGITFVQDEKSAKYPDMPRSAGSGVVHADFVLTPRQIAAELARIARHPYVADSKPAAHITPAAAAEGDLEQIFTLIRGETGVDFAHYKPTTIRRRISRRMLLHRVESVGEYVKQLRGSTEEIDALYQDLLINVTGFFRDPETFEALQKRIIPKIIENRDRSSSVRVWVPGCATGEEAYSIAICMLEELGDFGSHPPLQIFGTDVSASAVGKARVGAYPENIAIDVSPERLRRFFTKTNNGYQISRLVRDLCVFAPQNVVKDPPFSRLDLITCRNVLIYLGSPLQKRVLATFHYALKPSGFLLLGTSETAGASSDAFQLVDKKHKIYSKLPTATLPHFDFGTRLQGPTPVVGERAAKEVREASQLSDEADRIVLTKFAPAGVIVNPALHIVQFRGSTSPFLEPAPGEASFHLLKMAREGLLVDLRAALHQARKTKRPVRKEGLRVRLSGTTRVVNVEVRPLGTSGHRDSHYLVLFEQEPQQETPRPLLPPSGRSKKGNSTTTTRADHEIATLREELASSQADLQGIIEEQEASNEELQSANEEILSSNEELQSTNEELETAKEELQATNEELSTVNEELQNRNNELARANNDLLNLVGSVDIVIVMLGRDLRVRRFTPAAQRVLNLIPTDVGRPLSDIKPNLKLSDLSALIAEVIDTLTAKTIDVQDLQGRWYSMRIKPYKTSENKIEGAVLTLVDIDDLKRALERLDLYSRVFMTETRPIIIQDLEGRIIELNKEAERAYGWSRQELLGKTIKMIIPPDRHSETEDFWERCKKVRTLRDVQDFRWSKARKRIPVELTFNLLTDDQGEPVAMATIARHKETSEARSAHS